MKSNKKQSPEKYILSKARKLPFHECLINDTWKESGLATILISKKQPGGNYTYAMYLVDVFCLGLKNTLFNFNYNEAMYKEMKETYVYGHENVVTCDIVKAHNIIYGAIDYAEELGFQPDKHFKITEYLLNPNLINDGIDEIEFGYEGKPFFIAGPDDNTSRIISILEKNVGKGNFEIMFSDI